MKKIIVLTLVILTSSCSLKKKSNSEVVVDVNLKYKEYTPSGNEIIISRADYYNKLKGFWLAQCIANWTGLVTEMDKIGNIGEFKTGNFYTRNDWGKKDLPKYNRKGKPDRNIDFVFEGDDGMWGADDDTDIEYIFQHLLYTNKTSKLNGNQIRDGWLKHIKNEEQNYLWVSNQRALDLMMSGLSPPETSDPKNNPYFDMIDAQLTTEIFGFYAPGRPDFAVEIAELPIRTTARFNAEWISKFYVSMYSLAAVSNPNLSVRENLIAMAEKSRNQLPNNSYASKMYDFVKDQYEKGLSWETIRDNVYVRYQVEEKDGYDITSRNMKCNGCAAAGINFAASIISLFTGEGDLKETIKIGSLLGWDSDNPTATWGGLIGFMIGQDGVEKAFNRSFSEEYNIHRTRQNFQNGIDNFSNMAEIGIFITDRVIQEELGGGIDLNENLWYIPLEN
ncbi:MAG: ADP-ribosylglycohydrolase family protein [Salibacteraceae bacterium]|nr:ADP-ribosylglycohydrolase family protein [Salibacteraceae bacterium]|tara:strand:- start:7242 stop:8585 length:1344 start_codon:yes stop_codon:yes gene_type:complete